MKKKLPKKGKRGESEFDKLARLIKDEGEDIRGEVTDVRGGLAGLRTEMSKRFDAVDEQLRDIRAELSDIRRCIERLEEQGAIQAGYAKEIDHLLQRVVYIERHLGIAKSRGR